MIYFPLIVKPNQTIAVATRARSVYYESANGAGDTSVKVVMQGGAGSEYVLKVGQGFRASSDYDQLLISNYKSEADIVGFLVFADAGFFDNRVVGTVSVSGIVSVTGNVNTIDAGHNRSLANQSFIAVKKRSGTNPCVQLWNPAGSGKNIIVPQIIYTNEGGADVSLYATTIALTDPENPPTSKRLLSGFAPVSQVKSTAGGAIPPVAGTLLYLMNKAAASQDNIKFEDPLIVPPGTGLMACVPGGAQVLNIVFDFYEE